MSIISSNHCLSVQTLTIVLNPVRVTLLFAVLVTMTLTAGSTRSDFVIDSLDTGREADVARSEGLTVDVDSAELSNLASEPVAPVTRTEAVAAASSLAVIELTVELSDADEDDRTALEAEVLFPASLGELTAALMAGSASIVGVVTSLELAELADDFETAEDASKTSSSEVAEIEFLGESSAAVFMARLALVDRCVVAPSVFAMDVVLVMASLSLST